MVPNNLRVHATGYVSFNACKCTACDEQDVSCVHFNELLIWVLASTLWWHIDYRAFKQFQQGLLYTLARYISGDGWVVTFAGNLIDFIDENDTSLGGFHIVVCCLNQSGQYAFHVFSHITCLRQYRGIHNGKGHLQHASDASGQQGFTCSRFTHKHDIGLFDFKIINSSLEYALVVVVYGHR